MLAGLGAVYFISYRDKDAGRRHEIVTLLSRD